MFPRSVRLRNTSPRQRGPAHLAADGGSPVADGTHTFTLGATSGLPAGTVFTYAIDWNGDGVVDQTVSGPSGTTVTHSYAATITCSVGVTATAHIGAEDFTSYVTNQFVTIFAVTATVQADPGEATRSALVVEGTAGANYLVLSPGAGNAVALSVNGYSVGSFSAPGGAAFAHIPPGPSPRRPALLATEPFPPGEASPAPASRSRRRVPGQP